MKEKIITSVKTCMRIKRVKPTRNKCIRKLRRLRIWLGVEPLPIAPDDALESLFWLLLRTTQFPGFYSVFLNKGKLIETEYQASVETLQLQSKSQYGVEIYNRVPQKSEYRERLTLSLQGNEATLSFLSKILSEDQNAAASAPHSVPAVDCRP